MSDPAFKHLEAKRRGRRNNKKSIADSNTEYYRANRVRLNERRRERYRKKTEAAMAQVIFHELSMTMDRAARVADLIASKVFDAFFRKK